VDLILAQEDCSPCPVNTKNTKSLRNKILRFLTVMSQKTAFQVIIWWGGRVQVKPGLFNFTGIKKDASIVTVDPGSNPDHDNLGGERGKFIVRRVDKK
jgi:hypothetical protein